MAKTARDLAQATGLSRHSVYAAIRRGELPGYYAGQKVVIPDEAFEDFIRGRWVPNPRHMIFQPRAATDEVECGPEGPGNRTQ